MSLYTTLDQATTTEQDPMMSTDLTTLEAPIKKINFWTLLRVEFRKLTDTRSGRWLLAFILAITVVVMVWILVDSDGPGRANIATYGEALGPVLGALTPILGLLAMTSEWTQRSALTTFTLAPRRLPVIAAKFLSAIVLTTIVNVIGLVLAVAATAVGGMVSGVDASYVGTSGIVRGLMITGLLTTTMAAAFGALAAQTAVAFGAYFLAPTAFILLSAAILKDATPWFDIYSSYERLSSTDPWSNFGYTAVSVAVWIVIPATIGIIRSLRREVK